MIQFIILIQLINLSSLNMKKPDKEQFFVIKLLLKFNCLFKFILVFKKKESKRLQLLKSLDLTDLCEKQKL